MKTKVRRNYIGDTITIKNKLGNIIRGTITNKIPSSRRTYILTTNEKSYLVILRKEGARVIGVIPSTYMLSH